MMDRSPWPVALVMSRHGRDVYGRECGDAGDLESKAAAVYRDDDLASPVSSGSVPTAGMVVLPCTTNTLAKVAAGQADSLITRAAHCHLKEQRKLILCVRETPWTGIDYSNAERIASAGGVVMPISPPFYMFAGIPPREVSLEDIMGAFVDRVLALLGRSGARNWGDIC
jgi:4-hydroxy-3-polyprenylbenzoate decarboxylase